jgi:hypothetical protein
VRTSLGTLLAWASLTAFALVLATGALAVFAAGVISGYYLQPWEVRPDHAMDAWLRPGGPVGVLLGTIGTGLMVAMLSYTVRKFLGNVSWLGAPVWWLRFHILCGVFGPIYIVLHAGLLPPWGLVAVGFWCMLLVALSGGFGRYVYGHFPKTAAGRAMDEKAARSALAELRARLVAETASADGARIGAAVALARDLDVQVRSIPGWLWLDFEVRRRGRRVRALLSESGLSGTSLRTASRTLEDQLRLRRNVAAWDVSKRMFKYWHLFHEPLAKAMYLIAAVHVLNAILFGGALQQLAVLVPW